MSCIDPFHAARLQASLDTIELFGGIRMVQKCNAELYEYVYSNVAEMKLDIMSPRENHGGHFAIKFDKTLKSKLIKLMDDNNIIVDYRDFNETSFVVRAGFIAMYNDKSDCDAFLDTLHQFIDSI